MFQEKGEIVIEKADRDEDEVFVVTITPEDFSQVREALEVQGIELLEAAEKII